MAKRGVLYVVWGEYGVGTLRRSRQSLARVHPNMPVEVIDMLKKEGVYRPPSL